MKSSSNVERWISLQDRSNFLWIIEANKLQCIHFVLIIRTHEVSYTNFNNILHISRLIISRELIVLRTFTSLVRGEGRVNLGRNESYDVWRIGNVAQFFDVNVRIYWYAQAYHTRELPALPHRSFSHFLLGFWSKKLVEVLEIWTVSSYH